RTVPSQYLMIQMNSAWPVIILNAIALMLPARSQSALLNKQELLERENFWDNRDWDWYKENIPFFECPDAEINTTYYYRWELVTKHLTYGSPKSGIASRSLLIARFGPGPTAPLAVRQAISFMKFAGCVTRNSPATIPAIGFAH